MNSVLLLEDLPEIRVWLSRLVQRVFPQAQVMECALIKHAMDFANRHAFDLALIDLGLPDGSGVQLIRHLNKIQPNTRAVVVSIHDDDEHVFEALQAGAFGYIIKEQASEMVAEQLQRISQGEPPLSPSVARRVISHFSRPAKSPEPELQPVSLTARETEVLFRVGKGFTLPEIGVQLGLSRHTIADYVKQIYRKLNVSSRAEAALEAHRLGLFR